MKKLAIHAPREDELYTVETEIRCFGCSDAAGGKAVESDPRVSAQREYQPTLTT